jgi:threonine dehydrogenase-like Zn-dependent dehydrogenase
MPTTLRRIASGSRKAASNTTRAAELYAPGRFRIIDQPLPEPEPHEICVRLQGCGVCASNVPVWEGRPWFEYPREPGSPGHEGWGIVDRVGAKVTAFRRGDRVALLSYRAFAEHDLAHADEAVLLPRALDDCPAPGEPLACAVNVFRRSDIRPGQTVTIVGVGFLGALLVQLARRAGAEVIAVSRRDWALDVAEQCGAQHRIRFDQPQRVQDQVRRIAGEDGCPRVIEAVGHQAALDVAGELVGTRGKLVVAGYHQDGLRHVDMQSWNWRGIDVINAHERDPQIYLRGMREAFSLVADGRLDPRPLMTHRFPLDELPQALEMSVRRPAGFLKALIMNEPPPGA